MNAPAAQLDRPRVSCRQIVALVSMHMGVGEREILGSSRSVHIARARFACYWLAAKTTGYSQPRIGQAMDRDHSTVRTGVIRAEELREDDPMFKALTDHLFVVIDAALTNWKLA